MKSFVFVSYWHVFISYHVRILTYRVDTINNTIIRFDILSRTIQCPLFIVPNHHASSVWDIRWFHLLLPPFHTHLHTLKIVSLFALFTLKIYTYLYSCTKLIISILFLLIHRQNHFSYLFKMLIKVHNSHFFNICVQLRNFYVAEKIFYVCSQMQLYIFMSAKRKLYIKYF